MSEPARTKGAPRRSPTRRRRLLRISLELLAFTFLVGGTAALVRPLGAAMQGRMIALRDRGISALEAVLDRRIEYGYLGPSVFGTLDIKDLRILGTDGVTVASVSRLRLSYSLPELFSGDPLGALRSLRLDNLILRLDAGRDSDLIDLFRTGDGSASGSGRNPIQSLPRHVDLRIRGGDLAYTDGDTEYRLSALSVKASLAEDVCTVDGSWLLSFRGAFAPTGFRTLTLNARGSGDYDFSNGRGDLAFDLSTMHAEYISLKNLSFRVLLDESGMELRKIKDRTPYDLVFRYDAPENSWSGEFLAEGFSPRSLGVLNGPWKTYDAWLDVALSGTLSGKFSPGSPPSYQADLRGSFPRVMPLGRGIVALRGQGVSDRIDLDELSYAGRFGAAIFRGSLALRSRTVDGNLSISDLRTPRGGMLRGDFGISTEGSEYIVFGENVGIGDVALSTLDARIVPSGDAFNFSLSALRFADLESYEDVRLSRINAEGAFIPGDGFLQTTLSLDSLSASDALGLVTPFAATAPPDPRLEEYLDRVQITTELFITTNFKNFSINAPRLVAAYRGTMDLFLVASLSGTDKRIELQDGKAIWAGGVVDLSAYMDYSDSADLAFGVRTTYKNIPYYIDGLYLDRRSFSVQGSYGLAANFSRNDDGGISGFLVSEGIPLPLGNQRATLSASASFRWNSADSWSINMDRMDVDELSLPSSPSVRIRLQGSVDQTGAVFPLLSYDDGRGLLGGRVEVSWSRGYTSPTAVLRLSDQSGAERYEAEGSLFSDGAALRVYVSRGQVSRVLRNSYGALATGEMRLAWTSETDYSADWRVSRLQARMGEREFNLSASGSLGPRNLNLEDLRFSYGGIQVEVPMARVDLDASAVSGAGRIRGVLLSRDTDILMDASASFAPIPSWKDMAATLSTVEGVVRVSRFRMDDWETDAPFDFNVSRNAEYLSVVGGPRDSLRLRWAGDGAFYAALSNPSPIRGSLTGTLVKGIIEAKTENLYLDMEDLWALVPDTLRDEVSFTGGFAEASVKVSGPIGDPEFFGSAVGSGISLRVPKWVDAEIGPVGVFLALDGNQMTFEPIEVAVGPGRGTASGRFVFERWIPSSVYLDASIAPEQSIPFITDIFGVRGKGLVYGTIGLVADKTDFEIRGLLYPHATLITLDTRAMAEMQAQGVAAPEAGARPVRVDLRLITGRRVEFAWPADDFPIVRGYADVGTGFTVQGDSGIGRFSMKGDVRLRGGEVFYFQRSFYIREGILRFNENELGFDPKVILRAELRDRTDEGPVTIALVVDEAPLSRFTPRLESDPPLSQYEIISLLGQNLSNADPEAEADRFQDALLTASSDLLAQFNVIRVFERNVRDALGLDMFSVRTQVLQNAVLQATGLRSDPVDRIGGLGNYFDNTTVFFGKYLGADLFLQSMLSLRYDEYKSYDLFGGLTLEPDIGVEMKTPLFTLRWNFVPAAASSQNLFIDDHSFTLSWKWSF